jgi:molecular chaperone HscB
MKLGDDDFTLFALPQRFALERSALDERWRALQSEVHPDRFVREGGASQRVAMQWAVRINEAYQRLKDPLRRAAYLCALRGEPVDEHSNTAMPPAFLAQQMEWREELDEAGDVASIERLDGEVRAHESRLLDELQATLDERDDARAAAEQVRALMFVARFRDDIRRRLEALDDA